MRHTTTATASAAKVDGTRMRPNTAPQNIDRNVASLRLCVSVFVCAGVYSKTPHLTTRKHLHKSVMWFGRWWMDSVDAQLLEQSSANIRFHLVYASALSFAHCVVCVCVCVSAWNTTKSTGSSSDPFDKETRYSVRLALRHFSVQAGQAYRDYTICVEHTAASTHKIHSQRVRLITVDKHCREK